ncbi:MAG: TlpA disulfide reductase family protein [Nannocystaceae bacterium]|jgi:peroxiredoxin
MHRRSELTRALVVVAFALACQPQGASRNPDAALDVALPDLRGALVRPTPASERDVFVFAFWATWCQPCQQELAQMDRVLAPMSTRGLQLFAISIDGPDTAAQVAPWVEREGYDFPVLLDRETQVLTRYNPRGDIPYYVVLDASGRVLDDHQGYMAGDVDTLAAELERLLPAAPAE